MKANMRQAGELVCFPRGSSIGTEVGGGEGIHYGSYYDYRLIIDIAHNIILVFCSRFHELIKSFSL